jgi:transcriptional regulator with XRE-family HTH domain
MVDRILLVLRVKNLSPSKFADEIGIQRSSMSHIMSGRNLPSLDLITKIMNKFPDINPDWLLMGNGQMIKSKQIDLFDSIPLVEEMKPEINTVVESLPLIEAINEVSGTQPSKKPAENDLTEPVPEVKYSQNEETKHQDADKFILPSQPEIEKIVILYKNKSFKEYYPSL